MSITVEDNDLKRTYNILKSDGLLSRDVLNFEPESFDVIKTVEEHKNFWKPEKVKVLLLAESHVYTEKDEWSNLLDIPNLKHIPKHFVKLVYCLGYGEPEIVPSSIRNNRGTWQFWKIFASCVSKDRQLSDVNKITKISAKNLSDRIKNKLDILNKLKERGIWLTDASIVALYHNDGKSKKPLKPSPATMKRIINLCWENYISKIIEKEKPKYILVIGMGVYKILKNNIEKKSIPHDKINQPQSRSFSIKDLEKCFDICNKL